MFVSLIILLTAQTASAFETGSDSDGDGLLDVWETQVFGTDPTLKDSDGDRFDDRVEIEKGFNPLGKDDLQDKDVDGDGLVDRLELAFGADPLVKDTDADGYEDGVEVMGAFSPTSTVRTPLPRSIRINIAKQELTQNVLGIAIKKHIVSSGLPRTPTPIGTFRILQKHPRAWSSSAKLWMPYWMHFSGRGHGLHELPEWPNGRKEGASHLGKKASHGCVRLGVGSAKELYEWTSVGTPVIVVAR
ncbi:L,D-transpeptidase [Patescibacteria group bacterium]|nr:L,D-transpeptidase [Patescibacteria group bacterium]